MPYFVFHFFCFFLVNTPEKCLKKMGKKSKKQKWYLARSVFCPHHSFLFFQPLIFFWLFTFHQLRTVVTKIHSSLPFFFLLFFENFPRHSCEFGGKNKPSLPSFAIFVKKYFFFLVLPKSCQGRVNWWVLVGDLSRLSGTQSFFFFNSKNETSVAFSFYSVSLFLFFFFFLFENKHITQLSPPHPPKHFTQVCSLFLFTVDIHTALGFSKGGFFMFTEYETFSRIFFPFVAFSECFIWLCFSLSISPP